MEYYGLHLNKSSLKNGVHKDTELTAMAFFLGPPQGWQTRTVSEIECQLFRNTLAACENLTPERVVVHGCYLMNPASLRDEVRQKSTKMFLNELQVCDNMGIGNYVFHPGCHTDPQKGLDYTIDMIKEGLQNSKEVNILVENMTQTNRLCQTWQDCKWIADHVNNSRLKFCMDTAHCWGAGEKKGMFMNTLLDDFDKIIGIDKLGAIHLNDSKVEYGANKDRHENILEGKIPKSFWKPFIFDERVKKIPTIMETPSNCRPVIAQLIAEGNCESSGSDDESSDSDEESSDSDEETSESDSDSSDENDEDKKETFLFLENMVPKQWKVALQSEFSKPYFEKLKQLLNKELNSKYKIFPSFGNIFNAFSLCDPDRVKVVIIAQDPYFRDGQAEGLSFSVPKGITIPSSLRNIFKELSSDIPDFVKPTHGHLVEWAKQGVFLLNSVLTVRSGTANSHKNFGWQQFTDAVIEYLNKHTKGVIFMLWGQQAQLKSKFISNELHHILTAAHPSGLSANRGFFGCKHFSTCNQLLIKMGKEPINWQI